MHKKGLAISKPISDGKKWKIWTILCLQAVNLAPKMDRDVRHGTSLVIRRASSGRPIVVLFWTKYAFPRQTKPRILKLTTSKGHSNLLTVFSFVNCEEKGYYRVFSVGQLSFDCRSYCGHSCRMQGCCSVSMLMIYQQSVRDAQPCATLMIRNFFGLSGLRMLTKQRRLSIMIYTWSEIGVLIMVFCSTLKRQSSCSLVAAMWLTNYPTLSFRCLERNSCRQSPSGILS